MAVQEKSGLAAGQSTQDWLEHLKWLGIKVEESRQAEASR